jgi:pimeloyl-ACP methyl ester carboxylesterase
VRTAWGDERRIPARGITLAVWDSGPWPLARERPARHGPLPVVLLHGLAGWHGEWDGTACSLASRRRVVALDQRGHGASSRRPGDTSREAHVTDVVTVLDALDIDRCVVVGQSLGGHTAMLTAASHPGRVAGLVMLEAGVGGNSDSLHDATVRWLRSWPRTFPNRSAAEDFIGGTEGARTAWADGLDVHGDGLVPRWDVDILEATLDSVHGGPDWDAWDQLSAPTWVVRATDGMLDEGQLARMARTSNVTVRIIEGGHDAHLDNPTAWVAVLEDVLAELGS